MSSNSPPERPDLTRLRRELRVLITAIAIVVLSVLALTAYLYHRFTAGVIVTP